MVLRQPPSPCVIEAELAKRLRVSEPWAVLYIEMHDEVHDEVDNREALATLERIVREAAGREALVDDRGDGDFVILTLPQRAEKIAASIVERFDRETQRATSVAIAIVTSERPSIKRVAQIDALAAELKALAKSKLGSNYVKDRHR